MTLVEPTGLAYLDLVTTLLQQTRLRDPHAGEWEAADLQWWWPRDRHLETGRQAVWLDGDQPVTAAVITDWGRKGGVDVLGEPTAEAWQWALERVAALGKPVETEVRVGADVSHLVAAGFEPADSYETMNLAAADVAPVPALAAGYRLTSRAESPAGEHHLAKRNGPLVEDALRQCSLYAADCDLSVIADDGSAACYGVFWPDPVTRVGLVEPMRTEDSHQGRGLARHLLGEGLRRLAAHGCTRLKVSHEVASTAAEKLYAGAGFKPVSHTVTYAFTPAGLLSAAR